MRTKKLTLFISLIISLLAILGFLFMGEKLMRTPDNQVVDSVSGILDIQHWQTRNDTPVYFVEALNLPMVDIQMAFDAGSARDGSQHGVAYLTNALLKEGTGELTADKLAEQFEEVGAEFSVDSHTDMAMISLRSLTQDDILTPALETLTQIIHQPAFLEAGFKREQAQTLTGLKYESQRPDKIAQKAFYAKLYPNQPYGHWVYGQEETIKKLTPADVKAFYNKYYVAKNAVITIVGALTTSQAKAIAEKLSNALAKGEHAPALPAVKDLEKTQIDKITFPSEQTHIMMGAPGMKREDPDFFALSVGNHILGGNSTVTRIFNEIRHKRGLAYDAHSYFVPMRERGPFVVGLQTKTEQAAEALKILQSTVSTFIAQGPTDQELEDAKLNLLGGYALRFDNNRAIAANVSMLGFYGLPLDYFDQYKKNIEKVSAATIRDAFARRIHPDQMVVVMVGR